MGNLQLEERKLGSIGTPQGAVISPFLFNLVMIGVAERLSQLPQVKYTIYADDITLWVLGGSDGHIESTLQEAIDNIEDCLKDTGLRCSPQKSELLILPPPGRLRKRAAEDAKKITLRTGDGTVIPHVQSIRVLGMHIEASRSNTTAIDRMVTKMGIATRLIKRISTRRQGMREANLLRLLQSFVMSHVTYVGAFHYWKQQEKDRINAAIRKSYKAALGLLNSTSNQALAELGVHNTLDEVSEAQRVSQLERLGSTKTGRAILQRLGINPPQVYEHQDRIVPIEDDIIRKIKVLPLPRNVHPDRNAERRAARARALAERHNSDEGVVYVDAAKHRDRPNTYVVVVAVRATTGELLNACSIKARTAAQAEEAAIALALASSPTITTVLSDSRTAIASYARNAVCGTAASLLPERKETTTHIRWFPAHVGCIAGGTVNRNEEADAIARELAHRAVLPAHRLRRRSWSP